MFSVQNLQQKKRGSQVVSGDRFSLRLGVKKKKNLSFMFQIYTIATVSPSPPARKQVHQKNDLDGLKLHRDLGKKESICNFLATL